jgi:hypothetical protein
MQLSAPILPFDSNSAVPSDGGSRQAPGNSRDSSPCAADFSAMLSAHSVDTRTESTANASASRTGAPTTPASSPLALDDSGRGAFLSGFRQGAAFGETDDVAVQQNAIATLVASGLPGNVAPRTELADAKIDLSLTSGSPGAVSADTAPSSPILGSDVVSTVQGGPFPGGMVNGKAQAGVRPYGLNANGPSVRKNFAMQQASALRGAGLMRPTSVAAGEVQGSVSVGMERNAVVNLQSAPSISPSEGCAPTASLLAQSESVAPGSAEALAIGAPPATAMSPVAAEVGGEVKGELGQAENFAVFPKIHQSINGPYPIENSPSVSPASAPASTPPAFSPDAADKSADEPRAVEATANVSAAFASNAPASSLDVSDIARLPAIEAVTEKIAARLSGSGDRSGLTEKATQKTALTTDIKLVETGYERIGINVAKPDALMTATASFPAPAPVATENSSLGQTPLSFDALVKDQGDGSTGHLDQVAHRAVESALAVAEQLAPGEQRFVRLQFTVGGEDLAVRVELRGDKVHTTFRTDSPELCTALAREWQAVSAVQSGERTQRLADPVFASSSSGFGQSLSSDSGATPQRDQGSRYSYAASEELSGIRRTFRSQPTVPVVPALSPTLSSQGSTSRRLHTFA